MTTDQQTGASRALGALVPRAALFAICLLALAAAGCAGSGRGTNDTGQAPGGSGGLEDLRLVRPLADDARSSIATTLVTGRPAATVVRPAHR